MFFVSVEVLTLFGLVRYFVFFVIDLESRKVEIAGITCSPHGAAGHKGHRETARSCFRTPRAERLRHFKWRD